MRACLSASWASARVASLALRDQRTLYALLGHWMTTRYARLFIVWNCVKNWRGSEENLKSKDWILSDAFLGMNENYLSRASYRHHTQRAQVESSHDRSRTNWRESHGENAFSPFYPVILAAQLPRPIILLYYGFRLLSRIESQRGTSRTSNLVHVMYPITQCCLQPLYNRASSILGLQPRHFTNPTSLTYCRPLLLAAFAVALPIELPADKIDAWSKGKATMLRLHNVYWHWTMPLFSRSSK